MKLIIPTRVADKIEPHLPSIAPDISVVHVDDAGALDGDAGDAEVYLRWWGQQSVFKIVLAAAPRLRWLHTPSAGVDYILIPEVLARDLLVTNSVGAHDIPIAEFVLMVMLEHTKRARELRTLTPETAWPRARELRLGELHGKTVLILGMGHIGQEVARRTLAFGMRVLGSRRRPAPIAGVEQVVGEVGWRALLPEADYVVIAAPLTPATAGMVDADAFGRMKPSAYLINIARGPIVDTEALIAALHAGQIGGAALDALPEEPLPAGHPLWSARNVWITPHIAWSSPHTTERTLAIFLDNLQRYARGQPLANLVDRAVGY